ncbi:recombinase family protein [Oerskovia enterophila]
MRALGVTRLSRTDDAATSLPRQREAIEAWCRINGHELVALTVDEDVSGDVAPWRRPALAEWLPAALGHRDATQDVLRASESRSRAHEWDALVVTNIDRLSRRAADLMAVADWCRSTGRRVYDTNGHEYASPGGAGAVLVGVASALAQGERERMVERAKASYKTLAASGRWRGGVAPYGYRPFTDSDGHKYLEPSPDAVAVIHEAHERILAGESVNSICADLNRREVPTPTGKPGAPWRVGNLSRVVTTQRLLGLLVEDRYDKEVGTRVEKPYRAPDGSYVQRAEPIVSRTRLEQVKAALAERKTGGAKKGARSNGSLLLGVLYCDSCSQRSETEEWKLVPCYTAYGRSRRMYRCSSKTVSGRGCRTPAIAADEIESVIVSGVLATHGDAPYMRREWDAGENHDDEIAGLTAALADLRNDRAAGLYRGERGAEEYRAQYVALEGRRDALEHLPRRAAGWMETPTGTTWRERWESLESIQERNAELRKMGTLYFVLAELGPVGKRVLALSPASLEAESLWELVHGKARRNLTR